MTTANKIYEGLLGVMRGYNSETSVRASVDTALRKCGLTPLLLRQDDLADVVADAMVGLRLSCDPARIGNLMLDLADYCDNNWSPGKTGIT